MSCLPALGALRPHPTWQVSPQATGRTGTCCHSTAMVGLSVQGGGTSPRGEPAWGLTAQRTFFLGRRCEFRKRHIPALGEVVKMSSFAFRMHVLVGSVTRGGTAITGEL